MAIVRAAGSRPKHVLLLFANVTMSFRPLVIGRPNEWLAYRLSWRIKGYLSAIFVLVGRNKAAEEFAVSATTIRTTITTHHSTRAHSRTAAEKLPAELGGGIAFQDCTPPPRLRRVAAALAFGPNSRTEVKTPDV